LVGLEGFMVGVYVGLVGANEIDGSAVGGLINHGDNEGVSVGAAVVG